MKASKLIRVLYVGVAAVAIVALAAINKDELAKSHVKAMQDDGSITNVLTLLIANGTFCNVRGHSWGQHMHVTLEHSPTRISCRECKVCGLHQEQHATEWR